MSIGPFRTFSTDANYPAGSDPWNGQPTKVEPPAATGGFLPNQGAAAEYFNKLFNDAFAQDQTLLDNVLDCDPNDAVVVTASSTITVPDNAIGAHVQMCGGGGGGGGGAAGMASLHQCAGGGGGGGAPLIQVLLSVVGGEDLDIVIGAGGISGVGGTSPNHGGDGANTTITRVTGTVLLATAAGGGGGGKGAIVANGCAYGQGGDSPRMNPTASTGVASEHTLIAESSVEVFGLYSQSISQSGAYGRSNNDQHDPSGAANQVRGGSSPQGFIGGATGWKAVGNDSGYFNGGCGGGGGAGPYGAGGGGGAGGTGHSGAAGGNGSAGSAGGANTGAGGGGGGAAGAGTSSGNAGAGGAGGSGKVTIVWILRGDA